VKSGDSDPDYVRIISEDLDAEAGIKIYRYRCDAEK
jgi:hypothetical protein